VVVLDQDGVIKTKAVVDRPAAAHGIPCKWSGAITYL
jgi:hypothetical protein